MANRKTIIPSILRRGIYTFLFLQGVFACLWMILFVIVGDLELKSIQPPPHPPWLGTLLWGIVTISSAITYLGFSHRVIWGKWRPLFLFSATSCALACINPILGIHTAGNTSLGAHLLYGLPLVFNLLILGLTVSKRCYRYIFLPGMNPLPANNARP